MNLIDSIAAGWQRAGYVGLDAIVASPQRSLSLHDLSGLASRFPTSLEGGKVALKCGDPVDFVAALCALDGRVASMLFVANDLPEDTTDLLLAEGGYDRLIEDIAWLEPLAGPSEARVAGTSWNLTTSGTTGLPKVVCQSFANLVRTIKVPKSNGPQPVWGLLYDPSRFAGLQVILQALLGGGILLLPDRSQDIGAQIAFLADRGCTHLSATPSLWRKMLMSPAISSLNLKQITLGGEIADGRILANLRMRFPEARVSHIYASTEIGVGFSVIDGREGFPASYLDDGVGGLKLTLKDECLWIKLPATFASPTAKHITVDDEGFICTNDRLEIRGDRVHFLGRESSLVNIGGVKIQLETLESLLREHPDVLECKFEPVPNPILGSILTVTIVPVDRGAEPSDLSKTIRRWCKSNFQPEAVPARVQIVSQLELSAAGKVKRAIK